MFTFAPRTKKPRVSLISTLTVKTARLFSSGGWNETLLIRSCAGRATLLTGIDFPPPGRVWTSVGPSTIFGDGTVVTWAEPLEFEAVTTARNVAPASVATRV